ncbi:Clp protease N-terminal domain-containing protein [Kordiimonas sp.]|uniref:Clp protease N-terminal domain-containing protein n=1 Tax=Kordiimonas sp. TaxID=1970157 RepID=UPI003A944439
MKTIKLLCESAERYAFEDHQEKPGAEHFLLAALELPDGTAKKVLAKFDVDTMCLKRSIEAQYSQALRKVGVEAPQMDNIGEDITPRTTLFRASASGEAVIQVLASQQKRRGDTKLLSAHVLAVLAETKVGVVARIFRILDLDAEIVKREAELVCISNVGWSLFFAKTRHQFNEIAGAIAIV